MAFVNQKHLKTKLLAGDAIGFIQGNLIGVIKIIRSATFFGGQGHE